MCYVLYAICYMVYAIWYMLCDICYMQCAICYMIYTMCYMLFATCYMLYAIWCPYKRTTVGSKCLFYPLCLPFTGRDTHKVLVTFLLLLYKKI